MDAGALFIQTDYLPDLITFLKDHEAYQEDVLDRHFKPVGPLEGDTPPLVS